MSEHLVRATKARHDDVMRRASAALQQMSKAGEAITFVAVARRAGVSTDFLYSSPTLRSKITELRGGRSAVASSPPKTDDASSTSAIRALSTQLKNSAGATATNSKGSRMPWPPLTARTWNSAGAWRNATSDVPSALEPH